MRAGTCPDSPLKDRPLTLMNMASCNGPGNAVCLPTDNGKTVHIDTVSRRLTMSVYGVGSPKVFLQLILKGPS